MKSYSETGIDQWINDNIELPATGFYVDLGCADPEQYSNTAFLRNRGWSGLAIDGSWQYADRWKSVPNVIWQNLVIADQPVVKWLNETQNTLVSRLHEAGLDTPAQNFGTVLRENNVTEIDFLAMDIEDSEPIALRQMFAAGIRPRVMVLEYHSQHAGRNPQTIQIPINEGYDLKHITNSDVVFVPNSDAALLFR